MENRFELSICIPTYNRSEYLAECLNSIFDQLDSNNKDSVEVCVSDNASEDNTKDIIEKFQKSHKNIKYFRWDKNMGADNNYLKVVEIASGNYCQLLGSDDVLLPNSINVALEKIKEYKAGIYLLNPIQFKEQLPKDICSTDTKTDLLYHSPPASNIIKELGEYFGYISGFIFQKCLWDEFAKYKRFVGSAYSLLYIYYEIIKKGVKLVRISRPMIGYRVDNDSFLLGYDYFKRIKLDISCYNDIAAYVFGKKSKEFKQVNAAVCKNHVIWHLRKAINIYEGNISFCIKTLLLSFRYYKFQKNFYKYVLPLLLKQFCQRSLGIRRKTS